jgi:hypothetical protein
MKNSKLYTTLIEIIGALFILLFTYTAISKLAGYAQFRRVLSMSPLIGTGANFVAWLLPSVELITSLLLFVPQTRKWGFFTSTILMSVFTLYIAYMILFEPKLPCSCGGVISQLSWKQHLLFNILFTLLAITGLWLSKKTKLFIAINRKSRTPV